MNILGIDRGSKQFGFAYTKQNIVLPAGVLPNNGDLYFSIAGMVAQHHISQIVIGYPKGNKGADAVDRLVKSIKVMLPEGCSVDTVDEHYTTVMAQAITGDYGKQKGFDDCLAAMEIVRRYQAKILDGQGLYSDYTMNQLLDIVTAKGGVTYNVLIDRVIKPQGWLFPRYPDLTKIIQTTSITVGYIVQYVEDNRRFFDESHFLGLWHNGINNSIYIDIIVSIDHKHDAYKLLEFIHSSSSRRIVSIYHGATGEVEYLDTVS